ncbi:FadR/GntR family transcriptional regulator [Cryobacterium sp. W22_MBD10_FK3]|uniref:FadR/GntR family transcriptional regulator n=1 Tax=Cryobacterium sp. W22_MBD10_FK3 TaxID=3240273 RepID=UPI003F93412D
MNVEPSVRNGAGSLAEKVERLLRAQIVGGGVGPGDKLPSESGLMEQFGVSRTVVREAVSRLQAAGLVETYRGKGTFVLTRPSEEAFRVHPEEIHTVANRIELIDFRLGVEVEAASLAALRHTPAQLDDIATALDAFRASRAKPSGAVEADFRFHLLIAVASNNHYYAELMSSLGPTMIAMPQTRLHAADEPGRDEHFSRVTFEHEAIFTAIERRDAAGANAAARVHLANSRDRLANRPPSGWMR